MSVNSIVQGTAWGASVLLLFFSAVSPGYADTTDLTSTLPGTWRWGHSVSADGKGYLIRTSELVDEPGITFSKDGTLVEKKNSGFCGTPPISYGDFEGTWELGQDSTVEMDVAFWGGRTTSVYRVVPINSDKLEIENLDIQYNHQPR